jgi:hypothetical protein
MPGKDNDKFDAFDALEAMARGEEVAPEESKPEPPAKKPAPKPAPEPPAEAPKSTQNHQNTTGGAQPAPGQPRSGPPAPASAL